jgi:hypothetical protein
MIYKKHKTKMNLYISQEKKTYQFLLKQIVMINPKHPFEMN